MSFIGWGVGRQPAASSSTSSPRCYGERITRRQLDDQTQLLQRRFQELLRGAALPPGSRAARPGARPAHRRRAAAPRGRPPRPRRSPTQDVVDRHHGHARAAGGRPLRPRAARARPRRCSATAASSRRRCAQDLVNQRLQRARHRRRAGERRRDRGALPPGARAGRPRVRPRAGRRPREDRHGRRTRSWRSGSRTIPSATARRRGCACATPPTCRRTSPSSPRRPTRPSRRTTTSTATTASPRPKRSARATSWSSSRPDADEKARAEARKKAEDMLAKVQAGRRLREAGAEALGRSRLAPARAATSASSRAARWCRRSRPRRSRSSPGQVERDRREPLRLPHHQGRGEAAGRPEAARRGARRDRADAHRRSAASSWRASRPRPTAARWCDGKRLADVAGSRLEGDARRSPPTRRGPGHRAREGVHRRGLRARRRRAERPHRDATTSSTCSSRSSASSRRCRRSPSSATGPPRTPSARAAEAARQGARARSCSRAPRRSGSTRRRPSSSRTVEEHRALRAPRRRRRRSSARSPDLRTDAFALTAEQPLAPKVYTVERRRGGGRAAGAHPRRPGGARRTTKDSPASTTLLQQKQQDALQAFMNAPEGARAAGAARSRCRPTPSPRADPAPDADGFALPGTRPLGCLLLHGFTATPAEVRPLGEALAAARLPGSCRAPRRTRHHAGRPRRAPAGATGSRRPTRGLADAARRDARGSWSSACRSARCSGSCSPPTRHGRRWRRSSAAARRSGCRPARRVASARCAGCRRCGGDSPCCRSAARDISDPVARAASRSYDVMPLPALLSLLELRARRAARARAGDAAGAASSTAATTTARRSSNVELPAPPPRLAPDRDARPRAELARGHARTSSATWWRGSRSTSWIAWRRR